MQNSLDRHFNSFLEEIQPGSFEEEMAAVSQCAAYSDTRVASLVKAVMVNEPYKDSKEDEFVPQGYHRRSGLCKRNIFNVHHLSPSHCSASSTNECT